VDVKLMPGASGPMKQFMNKRSGIKLLRAKSKKTLDMRTHSCGNDQNILGRLSMFRSCGRAIAVLFFCAFFATIVSAQGTRATITGVVQDPTGAAIPGAELSLRSLATSAVVKATAGPDGLYTFPGVVAGGYDLTVTASGFREYVQRGISVNLDQQVRVDVSLQ